jgi:hypothetical protein
MINDLRHTLAGGTAHHDAVIKLPLLRRDGMEAAGLGAETAHRREEGSSGLILWDEWRSLLHGRNGRNGTNFRHFPPREILQL